MNQSSIIAASLLAGFVLYLAANDRLKVYAAVLWGDTKAPLPSSEVPAGGFAAPGAAGGAASSGPLGGLLGKFPDFFGGNSGGGGAIEGAATLLLESGVP